MRLAAGAMIAAGLPLVISLAVATTAVAADAPTAPCRVERQADLPLIGVRPMRVAAEINGSPVTMIVDTGAEFTAITPQTVARLQLPADQWHGGLHRGVAAFSNSVNAVVRSFKIGGIELQGRSLSVVPLAPGLADSPEFAGLLGADFVYRFDLDIDLPHRALALYRNDGCNAGVPPWGVPVIAISLVRSMNNRLNLGVSLDGHPFRAILDTGATASLITRPNALRAGVTPAMLEADPAVSGRGLGTQVFEIRRHVFDELQIGPERFRNFPIAVGGTLLGGGDMLLGLDYLGSRRVWLSYKLRQMFIAATTAK